ncbi:hypothetical protein Q4S01_18390, partial [Morganella morganii]
MQSEPIITTNNMSADEVAAWITEKAQALQKLQSLRAERQREIRDHERTMARLDEDIARWEDFCPKGRAYEIEKITKGKLKYNPALYQHSSTEKHG